MPNRRKKSSPLNTKPPPPKAMRVSITLDSTPKKKVIAAASPAVTHLFLRRDLPISPKSRETSGQ